MYVDEKWLKVDDVHHFQSVQKYKNAFVKYKSHLSECWIEFPWYSIECSSW
jgi:hypothetical protein